MLGWGWDLVEGMKQQVEAVVKPGPPCISPPALDPFVAPLPPPREQPRQPDGLDPAAAPDSPPFRSYPSNAQRGFLSRDR